MKPEWIARQSRRPAGWFGEVVARVMAFETATANRFAVECLGVASHEAVLEVGCGHGRTLEALARQANGGFVAGIDPSDVMVRLASRRLRRPIAGGRAAVRRAEACRIPFADGRFDAVLAVHVLYFWPDCRAEIRELRRVLRPGGRLVLGFRPDDPDARAALPAAVYALRSPAEVEKLLAEAEFDEIRTERAIFGGTPFACTRARRPGEAA